MSSSDLWKTKMAKIALMGAMAILCIGGAVTFAMSMISNIRLGVWIGVIEVSLGALQWVPFTILALRKSSKTGS